jgi:NADPH:quinone reductase-like Zn-dependent oxidoreductase
MVERRVKALVCEKLGDSTEALGRPGGALKLAHVAPLPLAHPGSVRIRVAAAALNFADALQLQARRCIHMQQGVRGPRRRQTQI